MIRMQRMQKTVIGASALALLMGLGAAPASAQMAPTGRVLPQASHDGAAESKGSQEGIKVHGDWTIVVRNDDGSVASRHEFKNALAAGFDADKLLAQFLAGDMVPGHWGVLLSPGTLCNANNAPCRIVEAGTLIVANSTNLNVVVGGDNGKKLVMTGSVRVTNAGTISVVDTAVVGCSGGVAPTACLSNFEYGVTQRSLSPGIPVVANQTVDVTVIISFS